MYAPCFYYIYLYSFFVVYYHSCWLVDEVKLAVRKYLWGMAMALRRSHLTKKKRTLYRFASIHHLAILMPGLFTTVGTK